MPVPSAALFTPPLRRTLLGCSAIVSSVLGCSEPAPARPANVSLFAERATLRTDVIGDAADAAQATFVLVEAENRGSEPLWVTVGGELLDAAGASLGPLAPEQLHMPPTSKRVFVLVDQDDRSEPTAVRGALRLQEVRTAEPALPIAIEDVTTHADAGTRVVDGQTVQFGRVVVGARAVNTGGRTTTALIVATFRDRNQQPLSRPHTTVRLDPGQRQNLRFVGPPGSTSSDVFVADISLCGLVGNPCP